MKDYESQTSGITYFISGALLGAVAALLFAPKAGEETRKELVDFIDEKREKGRVVLGKVIDKIPGRVKEAGTAAVSEARERLS